MVEATVIGMLGLILVSLFSALVLLFRRGDRGTVMAKALTRSIGLSLALFVSLMAGPYFGVIALGGLSHAPGR